MADDGGPEWWRGAAIYQIYPRSFADSNGDGVGDLPGITARLPYVASLGVDGVWLSPFFPSPMRDFGYDILDHCGVDPSSGTLADFDALLVRAHGLGLKVIIDQVWTYTALEHPWFTESRSSRNNHRAEWYVWADAKADGSPPNNWRSWMGGPAWTWEPRRRQYYFHNFLPQMPDLNFHAADVQDAILAIARFWLDRGVDGFRLDTSNFYFHSRGLEDNPPQKGEYPSQMQQSIYNICQRENLEFLSRVRGVLDGYDGRMAMGEIASAHNIERMVEYTRGPSRLHTAYSFILLGEQFNPAFVASCMMPWQDQDNGGTAAWPTWAFSNHDTVRVATRWAGPESLPQRCQELIALLACLRGTILLYQGEELALQNADIPYEKLLDPYGKANWPLVTSRDGCRTPMPWRSADHAAGFTTGVPWLALDERHRARAVDLQESRADSTLNFTRRVLRHRRERPELRLGSFEPLVANDALLIAHRRWHDSASVLAFNFGPVACVQQLAPEVGNLKADVVVGDATIVDGRLMLGAWSGLIASATPAQLR